jgi:hypothetical protein
VIDTNIGPINKTFWAFKQVCKLQGDLEGACQRTFSTNPPQSTSFKRIKTDQSGNSWIAIYKFMMHDWNHTKFLMSVHAASNHLTPQFFNRHHENIQNNMDYFLNSRNMLLWSGNFSKTFILVPSLQFPDIIKQD